MPKLEMGIGFRVLTAVISVLILLTIGFFGGMRYVKNAQLDANIEVMAIDSEVSQDIREDTTKEKADTNEKLEKIKVVVDNDGYMSPEFMQLIQSAKSNAERRGDSSGIIHAITKP